MSEPKLWTRKEVESCRTDKSKTVFIIHNNIYDVHAFLEEHPGGHEVLADVKGKDASTNFDDIGHGTDAKELMKKFKIGELVESERTIIKKLRPVESYQSQKSENPSWFLPIVLLIIATYSYYYMFGSEGTSN